MVEQLSSASICTMNPGRAAQLLRLLLLPHSRLSLGVLGSEVFDRYFVSVWVLGLLRFTGLLTYLQYSAFRTPCPTHVCSALPERLDP